MSHNPTTAQPQHHTHSPFFSAISTLASISTWVSSACSDCSCCRLADVFSSCGCGCVCHHGARDTRHMTWGTRHTGHSAAQHRCISNGRSAGGTTTAAHQHQDKAQRRMQQETCTTQGLEASQNALPARSCRSLSPQINPTSPPTCCCAAAASASASSALSMADLRLVLR